MADSFFLGIYMTQSVMIFTILALCADTNLWSWAGWCAPEAGLSKRQAATLALSEQKSSSTVGCFGEGSNWV
jgi:hypothetical protein